MKRIMGLLYVAERLPDLLLVVWGSMIVLLLEEERTPDARDRHERPWRPREVEAVLLGRGRAPVAEKIVSVGTLTIVS